MKITPKKILALYLAIQLAVLTGVCQTTPLNNSHQHKVQSSNEQKMSEKPVPHFMEKKAKTTDQPNELLLNHTSHEIKPKQVDKALDPVKSN
jgi:hypothetical protein